MRTSPHAERQARRDVLMYRAWGAMQAIADGTDTAEQMGEHYLKDWIKRCVAETRAQVEALMAEVVA